MASMLDTQMPPLPLHLMSGTIWRVCKQSQSQMEGRRTRESYQSPCMLMSTGRAGGWPAVWLPTANIGAITGRFISRSDCSKL